MRLQMTLLNMERKIYWICLALGKQFQEGEKTEEMCGLGNGHNNFLIPKPRPCPYKGSQPAFPPSVSSTSHKREHAPCVYANKHSSVSGQILATFPSVV